MSKPWTAFPRACPPTKDMKVDFAQYKFLNDEKFLAGMHKELRDMATDAIIKKVGDVGGAAVVLAGGKDDSWAFYDGDTMKCPFRQEPYFRYLFAINEPGCYGVIDLAKKETVLCVPEVTDDSQRWNGTRLPLTYYSNRYMVNEARLNKDVDAVLQERKITKLYVLHGQNCDSDSFTVTPVDFKGVDKYTVDKEMLHPLLCETRVKKTAKEVQYIKACCKLSSEAHVFCMRNTRPGMFEMQLEAMFKGYCYFYGGSRALGYTCIAGSGEHGSVLHYGHAGRPNDGPLNDGDTIVIDAGAEYNGYATDFTRGYPVSGKFTPDQRAIHTAVYEMQSAVINAMKPGVKWTDMHLLAERVGIQHLIKIGILKGGTVEEMVAAHMGGVFMPHGLGHLMGLNVHDVGGYGPEHPKRTMVPGLQWLRTSRTLVEGMLLTAEPGLYFNDPTLNKALANPEQAKFLDQEVLNRFRGTGGCRLENNILITKDGHDDFTQIPCSADEIEECMAN